jgi:hypothetical protein
VVFTSVVPPGNGYFGPRCNRSVPWTGKWLMSFFVWPVTPVQASATHVMTGEVGGDLCVTIQHPGGYIDGTLAFVTVSYAIY